MRTAIYDYIDGLSAAQKGSFALSSELPYDTSGVPLYLKNFKRIYVDAAQVAQETAYDTLNSTGAVDEVTTVRVYFVTDAKVLPSNYDSLVSLIKDARLSADVSGVVQRLCQVTTRFEQDALVTELEFSFRKLILNQ